MTFLKALEEGVVVLDGAMGTMVQNLGLTAQDFGGPSYEMLADMLVFSKPRAISDIHLAYFRAGSNAVETNTFGACPLRLCEFDFTGLDVTSFEGIPEGLDLTRLSFEEMAYQMSRKGAEIACDARDRHREDADYDGRPLFVVGSIGPSNYVLSPSEADLKVGTWEGIEENFRIQVEGLIDGGVDVVLFETQQDVLEIKAAVSGAKIAMANKGKSVPIMAQVTADEFSRMQIFGTTIEAAITTLTGIGIDVFGINCSLGPDLMWPTVEKIAKMSPLPISVLPNAGLPENVDGQTVFPETPESLAPQVARFVTELGVNIVGGCCGTSPSHIRAIAGALEGAVRKDRKPETGTWLSGPQRAVELDSKDELIRIGERLNVRGSKKVREAVEHDGPTDFDALDEVIREQTDDLGCAVLDVCMDSNVVETKTTLPSVIRHACIDLPAVLCIDSFDVEALVEGVKAYPGRPLINSISMEGHEGESKADWVVSRTAFHNPLYIALAADDEGPAQTRDGKKAIADRLVATCGKYGVAPHQLLIDINAFPIGSESTPGMNFALESLESIPLIKNAHPGILTSIGVSNLTNGLAKKPYMRQVLTSVFLDEGRKRGLDAAIVNPNHYVPVESLDAGDYALGLKVVLEKDMDAYAELEDIAQVKQGKRVQKRSSYEGLSPAETVCEKIMDGFKKKEAGVVVFKGRKFAYADAIVRDAAAALATIEPLDLINDHLMVAMNRLGDRFAAGEASLPHLLKAADVMKAVMGFIEGLMADGKETALHKGTIVMGTVYQDVHSIGKDLTKTLLENYGFRVVDLGVQVPLEDFIRVAREENADAIGMSALLVQTANHMITVAKMMEEEGLDIPIFIGGAPVNLRHAATVGLKGTKALSRLKKDVFYCQTAMDSVNVMEALMGARREAAIEENGAKLEAAFMKGQQMSATREALLSTLPVREISFEDHPEIAVRPLETIQTPLSMMMLNRKSLFALNWKIGKKVRDTEEGEQQANRLYSEWIRKAEGEGLVTPVGKCAIFPANSDGCEIVIFDPENPEAEIARIKTSMEIGNGKRDQFCAASYVRPIESGVKDAVGIQIASAGPASGKGVLAFKEAGDSESALLLQGLSDRVAEDMAALLHARLRSLAGVTETAGNRYSPGYPGIPIEENRVLFDLLDAGSIGVTLTEAAEFAPTSTTAAMVLFHKTAKYAAE